MSNEITTTDLSKFGWRERKMAAELLTASCEQGLPDDFEDDGVTIMMNLNSGNVFLTNEEFQVAMMNGTKLESFYTCPYCGHEGFKDEMEHDAKNAECTEYLVAIGVAEASEDEEEQSA
jgi:hypothetical protein